MEYTFESIRDIVERQRAYFSINETLDVSFRISQLKKLKQAIISHQELLEEALKKDLGRDDFEAYLTDIGPCILEINETIRGLRKWARPETHFSGLMCFPSIFTKVYKMPYGVTLIISPFNFPILLSLGVLTASMAAGNTAIIKTSSKSEACSAALRKMIEETFPEEYITVINGGHDVADMCLDQRVDKIFYTGSPSVGRHVLEKASGKLIPVALELGGETGNWCIIRKDADIKDAARKIAFFKILNAGQICININQVAVAKEIAGGFVEELKKEYDRQIGDKKIYDSEYPRLINRKAFDKCLKEAEGYKDRIVYGGKGNEETLRFEPTVIYPVDIDEEIVKHELFCPLLPIVEYEDDRIDDLLKTISEREHPLAMYLFTKDVSWARRIMSTLQFGGGCINEVCIHLMVKGVPFNGTGHSGMGAYHGEWGFREFSHPQTVLFGKSGFDLPLRYHPYSKKKKDMIKRFEK
ncbi:MAG: aldehyde dehydrogenase family protein [Erysipelotrichaceae bacterium]|nr:aldehyde dehydrogenase family protein [Erysipelotrichaceae bacterium]